MKCDEVVTELRVCLDTLTGEYHVLFSAITPDPIAAQAIAKHLNNALAVMGPSVVLDQKNPEFVMDSPTTTN